MRKGIDPCMVNIVNFINNSTEFKTISCCCGHNRYPPTLLVRHPSYSGNYALEIFSHKVIKRKKRFYKKDEEGYYYIPELLNKPEFELIRRKKRKLLK